MDANCRSASAPNRAVRDARILRFGTGKAVTIVAG
jgi:hypothetical protein